MIEEVKRLCAAIPHDDLCIQWDICIEMIMWDGRFPTMQSPFKDMEGEIMARIKRICAPIPTDVELGFHLCYGDWEGEHFIQPEDAGKLVEVANALARAVDHPIAYIHMPVPKDRDDDAYYAPLKTLKLKPGTELYLGVVHKDDDEGTKRRIAVAAKYVPDFGIATECGMARARDKVTAKSMIKSHAAVTREP